MNAPPGPIASRDRPTCSEWCPGGVRPGLHPQRPDPGSVKTWTLSRPARTPRPRIPSRLGEDLMHGDGKRACQANAIVDPLPNVKLTPLVFGSVRWPLGFQGRRAMQPEPGLALLPEPIALALDHEGVAVMQESIEDGGGDDVVAEDLTPLRHALIRRDQHRRFLVAMAHELKEEMSTLAFERHVAELVDDEQLRFAVEEHPTREDALALAVDEVGEERRRRGEEHGVASLDDGAAEGDRQVRLADAGRPEE